MIIITAIIKRHKQLIFQKNTGDKQTMRRVAEPSWVLLGFNSSCNQLQILADHITTVIGWKMDGRLLLLY
jgi:hypothetical protein